MNIEELVTHTDDRGTLVQAYQLPKDGQVFYIHAKPGEMRGQHYHLIKTEHFIVAAGSAIIEVKDRVTNNLMKVELTSQKPMVVTVAPNNTHTITANGEGALILVWSDQNYDSNNPDTFMEEI